MAMLRDVEIMTRGINISMISDTTVPLYILLLSSKDVLSLQKSMNLPFLLADVKRDQMTDLCKRSREARIQTAKGKTYRCIRN